MASLAALAADPVLRETRYPDGWRCLAVEVAPAADAFAWMAQVAAETGAPVLVCVVNHEEVAALYGLGPSGRWSTFTRTGNYRDAIAEEHSRAEIADLDESDDDDIWAMTRAADAVLRRYAALADDLLAESDPRTAASIADWAADAGHPEVPVEAVAALLRRGDTFGGRFFERLLYMVGIADSVYVPDLGLISPGRADDDWALNRDPHPPRFSV
jgi:hypothetical protein